MQRINNKGKFPRLYPLSLVCMFMLLVQGNLFAQSVPTDAVPEPASEKPKVLREQCGHGKEGVHLAWKIFPSEVIGYRTSIDEVEGLAVDFNADSQVLTDAVRKHHHEADKLSQILTLKGRKDENILVKIFQDTSLVQNKIIFMMQSPMELRGAINRTGAVTSFYLRQAQKNVLSLLVELPAFPVQVGDRWTNAAELVSTPHGFICKHSDYFNEAKLVELRSEGQDTVAVIQLRMKEAVSGEVEGEYGPYSLVVQHFAIVEFAIGQGRILKYSGLYDQRVVGFTNIYDMTQEFLLEPLSEVKDWMKAME
ncbi:MAG: hypothetical protein U0176_15325 [Bacteroidia bacterium]